MKGKQSASQLSFGDSTQSAPVLQLVSKRHRQRGKRPGVVEQVRIAFSSGNRLATFSGFVLGGAVPIGSYTIAHNELMQATGWRQAALLALVLGGLLFSAKSVWQWTRTAFLDAWKASGFVLLIEGEMVLSSTAWLSYSALFLLVLVNGISTGCILAKDGGG